ncbi:nucleoid-associated protein [Halomonas sp. TRM85114]|nr:nucleoid-associated protein [Halomonas jincaotanensis]
MPTLHCIAHRLEKPTKWRSDSPSRQYLSWTHDRGGRKLAEGLAERLGAEEGIDATGETRTLLEVIPPQKRTLTQFGRFAGRAAGVSISFDSHLLGSSVEYDDTQDRLIIKQVPKQLREQLKRRWGS